MFCRRVDNFKTYFLILSVKIVTMIDSFSSSVDSTVGIDVINKVVEFFQSLTRTMMYSGFWN